MAWWQILLLIYCVTVFLITMVTIYLWGFNKFILLETPKELHDKTSMNWFGCILVWFFEFLLNPVIWIVVLVLGFFCWLLTVGRKY